MAPTLVASRTALPPMGAVFSLGRPSEKSLAPTLVASRTALPHEGPYFPWGGPAKNHWPSSLSHLSPRYTRGGQSCALGGLALRSSS